ncbi:hypothetical protein [Haloglomus halophilum]|uniref:hypothetical protein n=1 Tax=Haloglomus halophilum TaxID=2962672 RepID=UPI0020C9D5FD|nr:hypothetical protein [Haloglomus halophilum]
MQRRVAAIYLVFFVVMGASAYSVIAVAQQPTIDLDSEGLAVGDSMTVDGQTYTVSNISEQSSGGGGHGGGGGTTLVGQLSTTNDSFVYSAELSNGTALSPTNSSWTGKQGAFSATIQDGDSVQYNGTQQTANVSGGELSLVNATGNTTASFAVGDTLPYENATATVTEVGNTSATLVWGDNYEVVIPNGTDVSAFHAVQRFNVTERLRGDPDVENQVYSGDDGQFVRYRNGTTQPLDAYLPEPARTTFTEGDTLTYRAAEDLSVPANETTVANISSDRVLIEWTGPRTTSQELTEGANVTLAGQTHVVHFANPSTVVISSDIGSYQDQVEQQDYYHERVNGLWGISILSGFGALMIVALAYLPTRG